MMFNFERLRDVKAPSRSYSHAAAWDFYVPNSFTPLYGYNCDLIPEWEVKTLRQGEQLLIPSGIKMNLNGHYLMFHNKSGNATRGLLVGATIVDPDYQGEIHLHVWNVSHLEQVVRVGDKLLQATIHPLFNSQLNEIKDGEQLFTEASDRGKRGFGSTGKIHSGSQ